MQSQQTSDILKKKFIQCMYHIKDALNIGYYCCQGSVDHEPDKHVLPVSNPNHKVVTIGQWWPTYEDAFRNQK
jgi:hypothetical protein